MSTTAYITPDIIVWARKRAALSVVQFAEILDEQPEKIEAWENGEELPSFGKAEAIAKRLRIPFGYLFLSTPPDIDVPLPDLRTKTGARPQNPSLDLTEIVQNTLLKQQWYSDYLQESRSKKLRFVGSIHLQSSAVEAADEMRKWLGIDDQMRAKCKNWQKFKTEFVKRAEEIGVLVMQSSIAGYRRSLSVHEFRGFAIPDAFAPTIFINTRDAKAAQIFTLAHELVHIWLGESGVSNPDPRKRSTEEINAIERFCDKVATELLIPTKGFYQAWKFQQSLDQNTRRLVGKFRVSRYVAVRQAYELNQITKDRYLEFLDRNKKLWMPKENNTERDDADGGPRFYELFAARHSLRLIAGVVRALGQNRISYRNASALLGVKIATFKRVADRLV